MSKENIGLYILLIIIPVSISLLLYSMTVMSDAEYNYISLFAIGLLITSVFVVITRIKRIK